MRLIVLLLLAPVMVFAAQTKDYPYTPVPFTAVKVKDGFWSPRFATNSSRTVWYDYAKCEETGRIDNFAKAAKRKPGKHQGDPFDDSDVYKVIEGAAYCLALQPDARLEEYTDKLIDTIAAAQEPDGYLYTARTIHPENPPGRASKERWLNERGALGKGDSHELYNVGHLYEAACAYYQATGKRKLLGVAIRNADLVARTWGPGPEQLKIPSGHQEIEIGLVKLYRVTGDRKYLELSKFLLDCRGRNFEDPRAKRTPNPYYSDHIPVTEQEEAVGHAVRSGYMYSAMADVAALMGDQAYLASIQKLWENVVGKKLHLTGGIGSNPAGEAFGENYDLPNATAYNETCAAIANALWNHRMFLLEGDGKYIDVLERVIYNGFLSGVGMTGDRFFYPNPLESDGAGKFNHGHNERAPWFGCSCCPVNDVRFVPSVASFVYATMKEDVYVNLFVGGSAKFELGGRMLEIQQETAYPWDGRVKITLAPDQPMFVGLNLRIPGWAQNQPVPSDLYRYDDGVKPRVRLAVNGRSQEVEVTKGYARVERRWKAGDTVTLELEMLVRRVASNAAVKANANRFAIERGPIVYCAEGVDNGGKLLELVMAGKPMFQLEERANVLGGIVGISMTVPNGNALNLIPYYAWCHRGPNEMRVWHPTVAQVRLASHCWERDSVEACFDGKEPKGSNDENIPRFTWWPRQGSKEWVVRTFGKATRVESANVYWFDDTGAGGCRVPQSWQLFYREGQEWKPVAGASGYGVAKDAFNEVRFKPVTAEALKLEAQLQSGFSGGVLEWK
jgi:hypothetical protein